MFCRTEFLIEKNWIKYEIIEKIYVGADESDEILESCLVLSSHCRVFDSDHNFYSFGVVLGESLLFQNAFEGFDEF